MQKLFSLVLAFLALALVTFSCQKTDSDYGPRGARAGSQNAVIDDKIGEQHNEGLEFYLQNADFREGIKQIEPLTLKFGTTLGYSYEDMQKTLADPQVSDVIHSDSPADALREQYAAAGKKQELAYFNQLEKTLTTASTAEEAISRLNELAETIASDESLAEKSQITLLNGIEVGKHSADYWYKASLLGEKNPWAVKIGEGSGTNTSRSINWGVVAVHDVIGYMEGGWPGAVVASLISIWEQWP